MTQVNIGVLLDNLKIHKPEDYFKLSDRDRTKLLARVQSTAEHIADKVLENIKHTRGLKMHFRVSRDSKGRWHNIPNEVFARKLAFFAAKSLITFPFNEVAHWKKGDLDPLLILLCTVRPYLKEGYVNILPSYYKTNSFKGKLFNWNKERTLNKRYGLVSANFHVDELETQFEEEQYNPQVLELYLPYFKGLKPEDVINVRKGEANLYDKLENRLERLLSGHDDLQNEERLLKELYEIDQHVRELIEKYNAMQAAFRRRDIYTIIGFAAVGLILFLPADIAALGPVLGVGGINVLKYLEEKTKENKLYGQLREEDYFLFLRLSKPKTKFLSRHEPPEMWLS